MITELGKKCLFPSHHCVIFCCWSYCHQLFLYLSGCIRGATLMALLWMCFICGSGWNWLSCSGLLNDFFSRSISKPLITLVWPAGCFHSTSSPIHFFGLSPHFPGPRSPTPIFLSFSLLSLSFCYFSLLSIWWTCLSCFSQEVQEEVKDTRKNPKHHTFPQAIFFVYFVE